MTERRRRTSKATHSGDKPTISLHIYGLESPQNSAAAILRRHCNHFQPRLAKYRRKKHQLERYTTTRDYGDLNVYNLTFGEIVLSQQTKECHTGRQEDAKIFDAAMMSGELQLYTHRNGADDQGAIMTHMTDIIRFEVTG